MAATAGALVTNPRRAEAEAARVGALELERLEAHVSLLAFVAQVAPLLGLLGTVLGMVDLFAGIRGSGVDPALLASGIWKALLTTAGGLLVAIPALAGHTWLSTRIEGFRRRMADASLRILNSAGVAVAAEEVHV
jgi:biopolymer transport protein ExbB